MSFLGHARCGGAARVRRRSGELRSVVTGLAVGWGLFLQQVPQFVKAPDLVGLGEHESVTVDDD